MGVVTRVVAGLALVASACSESIVGDTVFFCDAMAACGSGQTCQACPGDSVFATRRVCAPAGVSLLDRCGGARADATEPDVTESDDAEVEDVPEIIDTTTPPPVAPTIRASRLSGPAPLAVVFTIDPLDPLLEHAWDFGDGAAIEVARGGAHVFTSPGKKTVTLTVRDGLGRTDDSSVDIDVAAADFGTPVCFASSFTGPLCPDGGFTLANAFFDVLMLQAVTKRRILLRRGDTFEAFTVSVLGSGSGWLGAYGSGDAPRVTTHNLDIAKIAVGGDWRVSDIAFAGTAGSTALVVPAEANVTLLAGVSYEGAGAFVAGDGEAVLIDTTVASGTVAFGHGAIVGGRYAGGVTIAGTPAVIVRASIETGLVVGAACDGLVSVTGADIRATGSAIAGSGCAASWSVVGNYLAGAGGIELGGGPVAAVHDNIVVMTAGDVGGVSVSGGGARVEHNTCFQPSGGGACVVIGGSARGTVTANTLFVAPAGSSAVRDAGSGSTTCAGCDLRLDPGADVFVSASPATASDFMPGPSSGALDAGLPLAHRRRDFGGRCRPAAGGPDLGAWERDALPCP